MGEQGLGTDTDWQSHCSEFHICPPPAYATPVTPGAPAQVLPSHHIVLVEGNYLLLEEQPWRQLRELFDDTWFADCPVDTAMDRVFQRQVRGASRS